VAHVADEAHDVLAAIGAAEVPLVLVGHAEGGLYTNALARVVAARVQGVLLLDPAHPDQARLDHDLPRRLLRRGGVDPLARMCADGALAGLRLTGFVRARRMQAPPFADARRHPAEARDAMWRHATQARAYRTAWREHRQLASGRGRADLDALGPFPPVPLVLLAHDPAVMVDRLVATRGLSRADAERLEACWGRLLRDRSWLSPVGRTETVDGCGHLIHLERPELTAARVANLVKRSRTEA
jgi:pimeloyl-ACP methyl ester carboxylesterase